MGEHLIEESRNGNRHSLAKLLYDNYEMVFKYLIKFTLNKSLAEDLVQETMVRAIGRFELFNPAKAKFSTRYRLRGEIKGNCGIGTDEMPFTFGLHNGQAYCSSLSFYSGICSFNGNMHLLYFAYVP